MVACGLTLFLSLFLCFSYASELQISANSFYANEKKGENILSGNVIVKKDKDILRSEKLDVFVDKQRKPIKYIATGNAKFEVFLSNKLYKGVADKLIYDVLKDVYEMNGNAFIEEQGSNKKIYGDLIVVDKKQEIYRVKGKDNKPTRFIFELETK
ncbi:lipopolysaccharide transport periplasmic protein LptA [Campylobacter sp. MIT 99-7217]|uniref:lipopolysaccharide transport periplasmic protein LptA n=1 Tax=Campylobacter sp. MIT 99-7217 TaxID=535091 RepID=UPI00115A2B8B|nr:lipopolysaccharide transport periplasmic protein LptA [Campylobacter sp. MIT 99-7217]TQR31905.1 lipopolysaccharide transport periplasmic protein LptA [Campylobacter sp. MIT 99-7217]